MRIEPVQLRYEAVQRRRLLAGDAGLWLCAGAISLCVLLVALFLGVMLWQGLGHFWPDAGDVSALQMSSQDGGGAVADRLSLVERWGIFIARGVEFVTQPPRQANTAGGIFPALFGTVLMVLIMTVFMFPLGVLAGVYLHDYAGQGWGVRMIRIAVVNLAGIPSIVYGVFGLAFFVYFIGKQVDLLFFPDSFPVPVFATPGILWASLTLALLTLPVVIVATEEGLAHIPRSLREGSYALGANRFETLWRIVLPMASPSMLTGLILAIARAAGEVAPLMLIGVVKMAPSLPVDGQFPYLHLERKFMHLGYHIYDAGFLGADNAASRSMVFATALLLLSVVISLNLTAILIRNRLRAKYDMLD